MSAPGPLRLRYEGEGAFSPVSPYWAKRGDLNFTVGEVYELQEVQERSSAQHRAYFASIKTAWESLPEDKLQQFPSPEALRKWALIRAGHCNQNIFPCANKTEALRLQKFLAPLDEFGVIDVRGNVVVRYVAHSQSYRAMDKERFRKSFDDVLRVIAEMIGTTASELSEAGKAAA